MCLYIDNNIELPKTDKSYFIAYKLLKKRENSLTGQYYSFLYKSGFNNADGKLKTTKLGVYTSIYKEKVDGPGGIHLFLNKNDALKYQLKKQPYYWHPFGITYVVVPVRCYYKDILYVGKNNINGISSLTDGAVIKRVYITLQDYKQALAN